MLQFPPADRFLEKLDGQPVQGAEMIVLSEHVDYWNHIGWNDPYSASFYSQRQSAYAKRFGLDSIYTPQMVVDGTSEFVGSNSGLADKALGLPKLPVRLSSISADASNTLHAHLETGALDASFGSREADVYVAVALTVLNRKCRRARTPVTDSRTRPWSKVLQRSVL